jgi:hypothetical protein
MNRDAQRTVAVLLARELFGATGSPPRMSLSAEGAYFDDYDRPRHGEAAYPRGEGAFLALDALGLLPPDVADWRQRFEVAGRGWSVGPSPDAEQKALVERHLDRLAASLAAATGTESRRALVGRMAAAFAMYLHTGLMRPEEASRWGERLEESLGTTVEEFERFEVGGLDPDELYELDELGEAEPRSPGAVLRVVPAVPARHDGLCITAVALHARGLELHWHELREGAIDPDDSLVPLGFQVSDDVGTDYAPFHSGGAHVTERDGVFAVMGHSTCTTAVPERATELRVVRGASQWRIPLG